MPVSLAIHMNNTEMVYWNSPILIFNKNLSSQVGVYTSKAKKKNMFVNGLPTDPNFWSGS